MAGAAGACVNDLLGMDDASLAAAVASGKIPLRSSGNPVASTNAAGTAAAAATAATAAMRSALASSATARRSGLGGGAGGALSGARGGMGAVALLNGDGGRFDVGGAQQQAEFLLAGGAAAQQADFRMGGGAAQQQQQQAEFLMGGRAAAQQQGDFRMGGGAAAQQQADFLLLQELAGQQAALLGGPQLAGGFPGVDISAFYGGGGEAARASMAEMEAKALAQSRSHSEAERRRRERINQHLATLRALLPSSSKADKATLLGEVLDVLRALHAERHTDKATLLGEVVDVLRALHAERRERQSSHNRPCPTPPLPCYPPPPPPPAPPPIQTDKATLLGEVVDVLRALHAERERRVQGTLSPFPLLHPPSAPSSPPHSDGSFVCMCEHWKRPLAATESPIRCCSPKTLLPL
ncbi:unnamed protein product [Closterium sp. NIES-65]|nr:unnamed protein product [Closterium sp. NIES-65]